LLIYLFIYHKNDGSIQFKSFTDIYYFAHTQYILGSLTNYSWVLLYISLVNVTNSHKKWS